MDRDPDTAVKGQGVLFQILSVTRKLSASERKVERGGSRSSTHKSTEERKNQRFRGIQRLRETTGGTEMEEAGITVEATRRC